MASCAIAAPMAGDADLLVVGARIFTASSERPWASALAVSGDRLLAVGTEAQAARWAGRRTRRIDAGGRVIVPGFIDAHTHVSDAAGEIGWTDLAGSRSLEDALDRLRIAAAGKRAGEWVVGTGWDEAKWPERRYLTRDDLDRVATDRAVVARRIDGHMGSVNSAALATAQSVVATRGFDVDASGRPTGILKEDAFSTFETQFKTREAGARGGGGRADVWAGGGWPGAGPGGPAAPTPPPEAPDHLSTPDRRPCACSISAGPISLSVSKTPDGRCRSARSCWAAIPGNPGRSSRPTGARPASGSAAGSR